MFQQTNKGYDVEIPRSQGTVAGWNASLSVGKGEVKHLYVYEVQTGFSLGGATGQSALTRSFFPRNRVQPVYTVLCQFPNQDMYADTIEWIRERQLSRRSSMVLTIVAKRLAVKGLSNGFMAEGYIKNIPRQHKRFEYAPELQIDFLIERIDSPTAWKDSLTATEMKGPRRLESWKDIVENKKSFRRNPDQPQPVAPSIIPDPSTDPRLRLP